MKEKAVTIELTPEQREQLEKKTGKQLPAVKLSLQPLEARVAPKLVGN
jgi:hypothetical protein